MQVVPCGRHAHRAHMLLGLDLLPSKVRALVTDDSVRVLHQCLYCVNHMCCLSDVICWLSLTCTSCYTAGPAVVHVCRCIGMYDPLWRQPDVMVLMLLPVAVTCRPSSMQSVRSLASKKLQNLLRTGCLGALTLGWCSVTNPVCLASVAAPC